MRKSVWTIVFFVTFVFASTSVFAKTPDGQPPSVETVCDNLHGAEYGLCTAYCEAMDCTDPNQHASNQACESIRKNWDKHTDGRPFPCEMPCKCSGMLALFAAIESGTVTVNSCLINDFFFVIHTENGDAYINNDPAYCNVNMEEEQTIVLDADDLLICRSRLRALLAARGIQCMTNE